MAYLNTDLELRATTDLTPLVEALNARSVFVLYHGDDGHGGRLASFETSQSYPSPEATIGALLDAVESLDPASLALWRACSERAVDIGHEGADRRSDYALSLPTLRRLIQLGVLLRFTIYPSFEG